jgi:cold-inducible RNA-binding protein
MSVKLFVGGIAYATADDGLKACFEQIGPVESAQIMKDRDTGRSRGFGFVVMVNDDDAQKAIDELNGSLLDDREITVSIAKPPSERTDRPRRFGAGGGSGGYQGNGGGSRGGYQGGNGGGSRGYQGSNSRSTGGGYGGGTSSY